MKKFVTESFNQFINEKKVAVTLGNEKIATLDDSDTVKYNKAVHKIKTSVDSVELEMFLDKYLTDLEFGTREAADFKEKILVAFDKHWNQNVPLTPFLDQLSNPISIDDLIGKNDIVKETSISYGGVPEEFINAMIMMDGKASSASVGKGELFLAFYTELASAAKLDLYNPKNKEIYEVKGEGGFRVGSQGKFAAEVIRKINDASNSMYDDKSPFNTTSRGKGLNLEEVYNDMTKRINNIDFKKFNQAFLTYEKTYQNSMNNELKKVFQAKNYQQFLSYLGVLQVYGYMEEEKIDHVIIFVDKFSKIISIDRNKSFSTFWKTYNGKLRVTGWENDGRNTSFRIFPVY